MLDFIFTPVQDASERPHVRVESVGRRVTGSDPVLENFRRDVVCGSDE